MQLAPALYAGIKLNTVQTIAPHIASYVEPARQHLINSTATEKTLLTVTQLGKLLNPPLSAIKTNRLLIDKGLQVKNPKKKSKKDASYIPTDLGKPYCDNTIATCSNNCDTIQQLRWYDSVLDVI